MSLEEAKKVINNIEQIDNKELDLKVVNNYINALKNYISLLEKEVKEQTKYADRYHALESAGVDNWEGYEYAQEEWWKWEGE